MRSFIQRHKFASIMIGTLLTAMVMCGAPTVWTIGATLGSAAIASSERLMSGIRFFVPQDRVGFYLNHGSQLTRQVVGGPLDPGQHRLAKDERYRTVPVGLQQFEVTFPKNSSRFTLPFATDRTDFITVRGDISLTNEAQLRRLAEQAWGDEPVTTEQAYMLEFGLATENAFNEVLIGCRGDGIAFDSPECAARLNAAMTGIGEVQPSIRIHAVTVQS